MKGLQINDIVVAVAIFIVLGIVIVPLPPFLLDFFIAVNISAAVVLLGTALFLNRPIDLAVLPTVILMITLFRLALNIASTRMILSKGEAGRVINAFGETVAAGNLIVGTIIFVVITVVQFLVITKGAERIAEVSARFTLDAMPGKQMAIDGELNMGLITPEVAQTRRKDLERESSFFGAMDGASKFVKGDAIAGIIMTLVNVIGGLLIGILQQGYTPAYAAQQYVILSIGDALGAIVPALITSVATGIIATRSTSSGESLSADAIKQFMQNPMALIVSGLLIFCISFVPGMPKILFIPLSLGIMYIGYTGMQSSQQQEVQEIEEQMKEQTEPPKSPEQMYGLLGVDALALYVGGKLVELADPAMGGTLIDDIGSLRQQMTIQLGYILPPVRICDHRYIGPYEYRIFVRGNAVANAEIYPQRYMVLKADWDRLFSGPPPNALNGWEPVRKEPTYWLQPDYLESLIKNGKWNAPYTTAVRALTYHLMETTIAHIDELMTKVDVRRVLEQVRQADPPLVDNLVPNVFTISDLRRILVNLVREKVSIRDIHYILERLEDYGSTTRDPDILSEKVRMCLARQICAQNAPDKRLLTITLSPDIEQQMEDSLQRLEDKFVISLDPDLARTIMGKIVDTVLKAQAKFGRKPILVCNPAIRLPLSRLIETFDSQIVVLSYVEISSDFKVEVVSMIELTEQSSPQRGSDLGMAVGQ